MRKHCLLLISQCPVVHRFKAILLLALLLPACANAQVGGLMHNSWVALGAGANHYGNGLGAGFNATVGKWLISTTALRGQYSMQMPMLVSGEGTAPTIHYGHVDIMADFYSALKGRNPSDRFRSYLGVGVGLVHSSTGDNDFCGVAIAGCDWKVSDDWRLFAELSAYVHPSDFNHYAKASMLEFVHLGVIYDIANNPTRSRSRFETQRFENDWFFNIALGTCSFNYRGIETFGQRVEQLTPIFEFGIGKCLTTLWQIRLCASGLYAKSSEELFSYYNIRGDLMMDPMALLMPAKPYCRFTAMPYLSAGIVTRLDDQSNFLFSPAVGMQLVYRADKRNSIYLDARYCVTPPRFARIDTQQSIYTVGMATAVIGYAYTFSRQSFR